MAPIDASAWTQYVEWLSAPEQKDRIPTPQGSGNRQYFELSYNGRTLKYAVDVIGNQPSTGYPLYIGLHGGGADSLEVNDQAWWTVFDQWYGYLVRQQGNAVYISARGISNRVATSDPKKFTLVDTYDLHSQPESYHLLQQMIVNFFSQMPNEIKNSGKNYSATQFVDSNKVYLLGFSAGGNGVFQLAPKIPDRFAAVSPGAGHPEGATFLNLARLPTLLQCGEVDVYDHPPIYFKRAEVYMRVQRELNKLRALMGNFGYRHECQIIKGGEHGNWANFGWMNEQPVLSNLAAWDADPKNPGGEDATNQPVNPVTWVAKETRDPVPSPVIWDLTSRPPRPEGPPAGWEPQRFFYWLYIRDLGSDDLGNYDVIRASYGKTKDGNWIQVIKATKYLGLLINEDMLDFKKDITVYDIKGKVGTITVGSSGLRPSPKLQLETLQARGDVKLSFSKMIYFEPKVEKPKAGESEWDVKVADSLSTAKVQKKLTARL
jgi:dienelactone hydrolase